MPKGVRSIECRTCGLVPGAKILQLWMVGNTVGGALGALFGTVTLIAALNVANAPEIRGHELMFTAAYLSLYALPAAVFAAAVSIVQRRVIARYHDVGGWWTGASAVGAGIGALLGFGLILSVKGPLWGGIHVVFGASSVSGTLSMGIGLGLGIGQWWHLRGLRLAFLWVPANLIGMVGGTLSLGWTASIFGAHRPLPLVVAQGVLAWFAASLVTGGTLAYLLNRSGRANVPFRTANATGVVDAQSAAKRALCLALLMLRARTERLWHPEPEPTGRRIEDLKADPGRDFRVQHIEWMKQEGLWDAASVRERALLEKPLGSWQSQELADSSWRAEALGVLMWGLGARIDFPPYDHLVHETNLEADMTKLVCDVSSLDQRTVQAFVRRAKLRDARAIRKARDVAEFWLWRARTTQLQREHVALPLPEGKTLEGIIAEAARAGERDGLFTPIDNDFPALGRSYAKLSETEWLKMRSIATERLHALNWLCRYADDWDHVSTDT